MEDPTVASIVSQHYMHLIASFLYTSVLIALIDYWRKNYPETFHDFDFFVPVLWLGGNMLIVAPAIPLEIWIFIVTILSSSAALVIMYSIANVSVNRRKAREEKLSLGGK